MSKETTRQWEQHLEGVFTACLLAYGVYPRLEKVGFLKVADWQDNVTNYLYGRMNYSRCKRTSREKQRVVARQRKIYREYLRWLRTHGGY